MSERFTPSEVITVSVDTATELEEHIKASEEVRRKLASCGVNEIQAEAGARSGIQHGLDCRYGRSVSSCPTHWHHP